MPGDDPTPPEPRQTTEEPGRPKWWTQTLLVGAVWWAYDAVNNLSPLREAAALAHGTAIVHLETLLHLDPERSLNRWLGHHLLVGRWLGTYYDLAHFAVTIVVLVYVWWRHPQRYRLLRNGLLAINAVGFVVFWAFPVAPPRMLSGLGFVDIVAVAHSVGAWSAGSLASQANEYAAMPSLHVAWALWCAFAVWTVRRDRGTRVLAVGYGVLTSLVVMATANHYFLDVVGGVLTVVVAMAVTTWFQRCTGRADQRARQPERNLRSAAGSAWTRR